VGSVDYGCPVTASAENGVKTGTVQICTGRAEMCWVTPLVTAHRDMWHEGKHG